MADKVKNISINAMERVVKESGDTVITKEWHGSELVIQRRLGLLDMMSFVDGVVKTCFTGDEHKYTPEVRDFAIRCSILEMYANFTLPQNVEKRYEFVYGCDAVDNVVQEIDATQFDLILQAIDEKIQFVADAHIEAINQQMNELYASFAELENHLSAVFEGVDADGMANIVKALQSGNLDEEKLVNAYFDARDKYEKHEFHGALVEKEAEDK
ncbi:MAG: hypothetical protein IJ640_02865 [Prevotella sp.]|nr:hypothetical protein [Prevotella sp.]